MPIKNGDFTSIEERHLLHEKIKELSKLTYTAITTGECKSCGTCIKYCPLGLRAFDEQGKAMTIKSTRECKDCSVCFHCCPQKAISLIPF